MHIKTAIMITLFLVTAIQLPKGNATSYKVTLLKSVPRRWEPNLFQVGLLNDNGLAAGATIIDCNISDCPYHEEIFLWPKLNKRPETTQAFAAKIW